MNRKWEIFLHALLFDFKYRDEWLLKKGVYIFQSLYDVSVDWNSNILYFLQYGYFFDEFDLL